MSIIIMKIHWQPFCKMIAILKMYDGSISVLFFLCVFEHNYQFWCFYPLLSIVNMKFYRKTAKFLIPLHVPNFSSFNCTKCHVSITYYPLLMWNLISKQAITGSHLEMAAILKIRHTSTSNFVLYVFGYKCTKFDAVIRKCTILI